MASSSGGSSIRHSLISFSFFTFDIRLISSFLGSSVVVDPLKGHPVSPIHTSMTPSPHTLVAKTSNFVARRPTTVEKFNRLNAIRSECTKFAGYDDAIAVPDNETIKLCLYVIQHGRVSDADTHLILYRKRDRKHVDATVNGKLRTMTKPNRRCKCCTIPLHYSSG